MDPPRWLADEMLGRLARYLRFMGHDTVYVRGLDDSEVAGRASAEHRILLTRDRALAARVPDALLLVSPHVGDQLREVQRAYPQRSYAVRFERCSLCNGRLHEWTPAPGEAGPLPGPRPGREPPKYFRCEACAHVFWEGSHTSAIRASLARWLAAGSLA